MAFLGDGFLATVRDAVEATGTFSFVEQRADAARRLTELLEEPPAEIRG